MTCPSKNCFTFLRCDVMMYISSSSWLTTDFQYKKDSVLVVTEAEYQKCRSTQPIFFSNNGDTVVTLDRPGLFYFISGVSGHCERGQKMIIKVLEPETSASPPPPNGSSPDSTQTNGGVERNAFSYKVISMVFVLSIVVINFT